MPINLYETPFTEKQRYANRRQKSLNKAKALSSRMEMFLNDLEKSEFKVNDRTKIKAEALNFLENLK